MASPRRLHWDDYARRSSGCFHLARIALQTGHATELHTHDFAEVFWVERGAATHLICGEPQAIARGDALFIRPDDSHAFRPETGTGITFVNLALPIAILREIEARYEWREAGQWPWRDTALPERRQVPPDLMARLPAATARLASGPPSRLMLDVFLLDFLSSFAGAMSGIGRHGEERDAANMPLWLADAVARFAAQDPLAGGSGRLAELAGRSPEHVNRTLRHCLGLTSSQLLNRLRAEHAGRQLRLGDRPIADIAFACGVNHLGYFYKLFHAHFGTTPARYRQTQRMGMDPPVP
jgi:AraC family cel operon transcriptional repressor